MQGRRCDLADLLTASGSAMAVSNQRLTAGGAPALLREMKLELDFTAAVRVPDDPHTLLLRPVAGPNPQFLPLFRTSPPNVRLTATFVAAPSLQPPGVVGGVGSP